MSKTDIEQAIEDSRKAQDIVERAHEQLAAAPKREEVKATPDPVIQIEDGMTKPEPAFIESHGILNDYFEVDRVGFSEGEKLRGVWQLLREQFPNKPVQEYLHQLRQIESKLGAPRIGQSRLNRVHGYLMIQKQIEDAERWRDGMINK